jgi:hypothetical protein
MFFKAVKPINTLSRRRFKVSHTFSRTDSPRNSSVIQSIAGQREHLRARATIRSLLADSPRSYSQQYPATLRLFSITCSSLQCSPRPAVRHWLLANAPAANRRQREATQQSDERSILHPSHNPASGKGHKGVHGLAAEPALRGS